VSNWIPSPVKSLVLIKLRSRVQTLLIGKLPGFVKRKSSAPWLKTAFSVSLATLQRQTVLVSRTK
jgi:hypothetical protein